MTWARVVDNEIIEIFEEDPAKYFHPDVLHEWVDIPNEGVHIGWKFKNGRWISGGQWWEEHYQEHPLPPAGPPTAQIMVDHKETRTHDQFVFTGAVGGVGEIDKWTIDGKVYTTEVVELEFAKGETLHTLQVELTVKGPGGSDTKKLEGDQAVIIAPVFVPLFQSRS